MKPLVCSPLLYRLSYLAVAFATQASLGKRGILPENHCGRAMRIACRKTEKPA